MKTLVLRRLQADDEQAFLKAFHSWDHASGFIFFHGFTPGMNFADYTALLKGYETGQNLPEGWLPSTSLCGFVGNDLVGRINIRHGLNDHLRQFGGHIGYGVVPPFRKKGYATEMLRRSLPLARDLGIEKILVTCDDNNLGSIKTIEACGGVLENKIPAGDGKPMKRRYWIS